MPQMCRTKTIRQTKYFELYQGYDQTANLYSIIRRYVTGIQETGYTTWFPEYRMKELLALSDTQFDAECSKLDYS